MLGRTNLLVDKETRHQLELPVISTSPVSLSLMINSLANIRPFGL